MAIYLNIFFVFLNVLYCGGYNANTFYLDRPGKNLCVRQDVDCSNQVKSSILVSQVCLMKYFNHSSKECSDEEFIGEPDLKNQYGIVNLTPFSWFDTGIPFPALNITFSNILWKRLKMRFVKVGSEDNQLCREFLLSQDVDNSTVISFDCLWNNGDNAGLNYKFQYIMTGVDGLRVLSTYLLKIPKDTINEIAGDSRLFVIMDETAFPIVSMKLLVPPLILNISNINVTLFYKEDLGSQAAELKSWTADVSNKREGEFVGIGTYDTKNALGFYYFNVSFYSQTCKNKCVESSTPLLLVTGSRFTLGILTVFTFLLLLIFGMFGLLLWRNMFKTVVKDSKTPPSLLFVYESCYPSHIENIYKFKEFLEENCNLAPKLDLIEIPKTDSMNPWKWYYSAFETADYVLVFASPDESTEKGIHVDNVYKDLYAYALKLLFVYLLHKHKFLVAKIKLPGCSWMTLPPQVLVVDKRFSLPEKLNQFLKFLNMHPMKNGSSILINKLKQTSMPPKLNVSKPSEPLLLPFHADDISLDEFREPLTVGKATLNLTGDSTSEEDEEDEEDDLKIRTFATDYRL